MSKKTHSNSHQASDLGTGAKGHIGGFKSGHGTFRASRLSSAPKSRGAGISGHTALGRVTKGKKLLG